MHAKKFVHGMPENALLTSIVWGHNTTRHLMEDRQKPKEVAFHGNARGIIDRVRNYFRCADVEPPALQETVALFEQFRAVHRLAVDAFGKVLQTGFLASLHCLQTHSKHPEFSQMLPTVAPVLERNPELAADMQEALTALMEHSADSADAGGRQGTPGLAGNMVGQGVELRARGGPQARVTRSKLDSERRWAALNTKVSEAEIMSIKEEAQRFASTMQWLGQDLQARQGIEHENDRLFETNKMVFAILGPHTLNYGEDKNDEHDEGVHLVFSRKVLHHPDVFSLPMCATFYNSGHADESRPWSPRPKGIDPFEKMAREKLHPSSPLYGHALAWEFLGRVAVDEKKPISNVSLPDVLKYWKKSNAHYVAECHLPYVTPLSFVEAAIVSEHSFAKLTREQQHHAKKLFGERLTITLTGKSTQQQWDCAMTPLCPPLPHSFAFTLMASRTSEVVLPAALRSKGQIFFRASAPHFAVTLCSQLSNTRAPINPITFKVSGIRCSAEDGSHGQVTGNAERFNRDLAADRAPVMYVLDFDAKQGIASLQHAGASRMLNSEKLVVKGMRNVPKVAVFAVRGHLVAFSDVRVLTSEEHAYEFERYEEPRASAKAAGKTPMPRDEAEETLSTRFWRFLGYKGKSEDEIPFCPAGTECAVAFQVKEADRDDDDRKHLQEFRHLCLYGMSCMHLDDPIHQRQFLHIEKATCPLSHCPQLSDVNHRTEFHHPGEWDVLLRCRQIACCNQAKLHRSKFHHEPLEYVISAAGISIKEQGVRYNGASSSGVHSGPRKYDFTGIEAEVQDSVDDMANIYNMDAVNGAYGDAQVDEHGNPVGFDLARDGAFKGFRLLIGAFFIPLVADLEKHTIKELRKKGWEVRVTTDLKNFTTQLRDGRFHVAWIVSYKGEIESVAADAFVTEVRKFHMAGRGLMVWGDNDPYFTHANQVLGSIFGFKLMGDTPGGRELVPDPRNNPENPGHFGKHLICSGILRLHEGVTICYPERVPDGWEVVGTSSNAKPVLMARDAPNVKAGPGRVVVDNGFTKLMDKYWTTAGTPRYVSNCCAWLALRERFKGPMRGFNPPKGV